MKICMQKRNLLNEKTQAILDKFDGDFQVDNNTCITTLNVAKGCQASAVGPKLVSAQSYWFSLTLLSGICGSLCQNYITVNDLKGSLQHRITFAEVKKLGKWEAAPTPADNTATKL